MKFSFRMSTSRGILMLFDLSFLLMVNLLLHHVFVLLHLVFLFKHSGIVRLMPILVQSIPKLLFANVQGFYYSVIKF